MNGNSLELVPRTSSSFENVARNWFERLLLIRLFKSTDTECTRFFIEYIELEKAMEYREVRPYAERVPPSIEDAFGAFH